VQLGCDQGCGRHIQILYNQPGKKDSLSHKKHPGKAAGLWVPGCGRDDPRVVPTMIIVKDERRVGLDL
jgi:hypothetical protein